jgi:hypothetical protein
LTRQTEWPTSLESLSVFIMYLTILLAGASMWQKGDGDEQTVKFTGQRRIRGEA